MYAFGTQEMQKYSFLNLVWKALQGHTNWEPVWREATPKRHYDVVVIGGGGHGLATAYYLAKVHGITRVAVLEKGWIGSGNAGRNTTIIRSNYLLPGNNPFYEWSMRLWEGLEQDLNCNAMVSQRGVLNLYHSDAQRDSYVRRGNAMRMHGVDAELLDALAVRRMLPFLDFDNPRFPIQGGLLRRRGVPRGMMLSYGAMPAPPAPVGSILFRAARLRVSYAKPGAS
jgi:heterotetrameric sarcosine oxidase beta subunit